MHSNGYSLVRRIVADAGLGWDAPFEGGTLGEALLAPTRLYVKQALSAIREGGVHALAHITGGGLTENLPRALPDGCGVRVNLDAITLPPILDWLIAQADLDESEALKTFNCGIGMVLIVAEGAVDNVVAALEDHGESVVHLGDVVDGAGVAYTGSLR